MNSLALRSDGTIVSWGQDNYGQVTDTPSTQSAAIIERYSYDVYGKPTIRDANNSVVSVSSVANRYMFTGREYDYETGNYYYRARYYSPRLGRFLQPDPIGYADGLNLYTYCGNNPIIWTDPWGLITGVEEGTITTVAPSAASWVYVTGGGTIVGAGTIVAAGAGVAVVSGGVGYAIGRYGVNPLLDAAGDALYDSVVNGSGEIIPGSEKYENDHAHGQWKDGHWHWRELHTDPETGKSREVRRTGPPDTFDLPPESDGNSNDESAGGGIVIPPKKDS